jgi:hypothetical protein
MAKSTLLGIGVDRDHSKLIPSPTPTLRRASGLGLFGGQFLNVSQQVEWRVEERDSVAECLPHIHKAQGSIPSTHCKEKICY